MAVLCWRTLFPQWLSRMALHSPRPNHVVINWESIAISLWRAILTQHIYWIHTAKMVQHEISPKGQCLKYDILGQGRISLLWPNLICQTGPCSHGICQGLRLACPYCGLFLQPSKAVSFLPWPVIHSMSFFRTVFSLFLHGSQAHTTIDGGEWLSVVLHGWWTQVPFYPQLWMLMVGVCSLADPPLVFMNQGKSLILLFMMWLGCPVGELTWWTWEQTFTLMLVLKIILRSRTWLLIAGGVGDRFKQTDCRDCCLGNLCGNTFLLLCTVGHVKCIESLVAYGANIDHNISHLGSPLYVACKHQQIACAKILLQAGKVKKQKQNEVWKWKVNWVNPDDPSI